jgi:hypothetical protein
MNHPPRLIEQGADRFELAALRAAEVDVGSERAMRRALSAIGAAAAFATPATAAAVLSKGAVALLVVKWVVVGAVAGATCAVAASAVRSGHLLSAPKTVVEVAATAPKPVAPSPEPGRHADEPATAPSPPEVSGPVRSSNRAAAPKAREPERTAEAAASPGLGTTARLSREVALLDQARAALKRGDRAAALAALDQRQTEVGTGMLGPEATVTRVEALLGQGNRAAASALAERFLAEHPRGPHADRLRSLLGGARP